MSTERLKPTDEPTERKTQPDNTEAPVRGADSPVRPDQGQTVFPQVVELQRQLQQVQAERDQAQAERDRIAKVEQERRERQAAAQRRYRKKHPEVGRRLNREWRARQRQKLLSSGSEPPDLPRLEQEAQNTDPERAERQQLRRKRNAAYMREYRARRRQNPM